MPRGAFGSEVGGLQPLENAPYSFGAPPPGEVVNSVHSCAFTKPMWSLAITAVLLPIMLLFAGAAFTSTQERSLGDTIGQTDTSSGGAATKLFAYVTGTMVIVLVAREFHVLLNKLLKSRLVLSVLLLSALSTIWSQDPLLTLRCVFWLLLSILFVYWLTVSLSVDQQMQLLMLTGFAAASMSILVVVLVPRVGLDAAHGNAWQGVFLSKNHMGRIMLFLLTPAIHYRSRGSNQEWIRGAYVVLILFMIAMSGSASAWLFTIAYLLFAGVLRQIGRVSKRDRYVSIVSVSAVFAVFGAVTVAYLQPILGLFGRDATLTGRTTIWKVLLLSIEKRPLLGYGYQAFWAGPRSEGMHAMIRIFGTMHFLTSYAHGGFISVVLEEGVVGLAVIALLMATGVRDAVSCLVNARDRSYTNWYIGILFLTVIYNLDEVTIEMPRYLPWMMCILALTALSAESASARRKPEMAT